ncbi:hypothetical protein PF011_g2275 [Phytophthora fragariae]|uniref:Peptidase C1A papain C-terminal domain-containing protein n=1 Tax=Phytophthora fragariae TaxID=53985 RepID=A0A6A3MEM2_9STRA|nr:hypothetical protein PF011_g2275 [Phytophthora fragariae]
MQPRVSTATVAFAVAVMTAGLSDTNTLVEARPMHAAIVSKYHRYLEEKDEVSVKLNAWLEVWGPTGPKNGYIPVTESRSSEDQLEDQRQRFYLTLEQIYEAREANPLADFGTDGPFTLMTMSEFKQFLSNYHINSEKSPAPEVQKPQRLSDNENGGNKKNSATEDPTPFVSERRLRTSGQSQYAYNGGDYSADAERGFQSTSDSYTQTSQPTHQGSGTNGENTNTNGGWNFGDISTGDSAKVGTVSTGSSWNWWGNNGWGYNGTWWGGNTWWNNGGGSNAGNTQWTPSPNSQWTPQPTGWTPPSGSSNSQWTPPSGSDNAKWSGSSNSQWTPSPTSSGNQWSAPGTDETPATEAPTTPAPTSAPATPPPTPPPVTNAPATEAPATAAPAPATKKKSTTTVLRTSDTVTAGDSDSDSVDWTKSGCVNPPGLQGQCGSCWAFSSIGALEAAQCISNGDKKAPTYSEQQLVSCDTKDYGCNGGAPVYAMEYLRDNGVCTKSSYPYTSVDGGTAAACSKNCTPTKSGITEIAQLKAGDESALLDAVKKQPVIASVTSNNAAWKQYMGGVITSCDTTTVDHVVLIVGYDATTIKIKNSWGTDWGEDGYVRISRGKQNMGTCAVLTDMSYPKL